MHEFSEHGIVFLWIEYLWSVNYSTAWYLLSLCPPVVKRWVNEKQNKQHSLNVLKGRCPEITDCANLTVGTSTAYVFLKVSHHNNFFQHILQYQNLLCFLIGLKCVAAIYPLPLQYWEWEKFCHPFCKFVLMQNYSYLLKCL